MENQASGGEVMEVIMGIICMLVFFGLIVAILLGGWDERKSSSGRLPRNPESHSAG